MIYPLNQLNNHLTQTSILSVKKVLIKNNNYTAYLIEYKSEELKISGLIAIPNRSKNLNTHLPLVAFNHGYVPLEQYATDKQYLRYLEPLVNSGFIVFKSDYRGYGSSEGKAESIVESGYAIDILNGLQAIKNTNFKKLFSVEIDLNKLFIWGHSQGGDTTLKVILNSPDFKAAAIWAAPTASYETYYKRWSDPDYLDSLPEDVKQRRLESQELLQEYVQNNSDTDFTQISPFNNIERINIPLQIHHGKLDDKVPVEDAESFTNALQKADKSVELIIYEQGDHNLSKQVDEAMNKTIDFYTRYL